MAGADKAAGAGSRFYIGTSGWSYPKGAGAWDGIFYPKSLADKDKLAYYAQYFNTVEINSSFYMAEQMVGIGERHEALRVLRREE